MRKFFLLAAAACAPVIFADTYPRQPGIDVQHYIFRVTLSDQTDQISGQTTIVVRFVDAGVTHVAFDLASPGGGKGMTVDEVTSRGAAVPHSHQANRLELTLPSAPERGALREFTVKYHGVPADGLKILKNKYGERCFFSVQLAGPGAPVAADHRPSLRQGHQRVHRHRAGAIPGGGERAAGGETRPGRRPAHDPLEAVRADRHVAEQHRRGAVRRAPFRHCGRHSARRRGSFIRIAMPESARSKSPRARPSNSSATHVGPYPYEKLADVQSRGQRRRHGSTPARSSTARTR